MRIEKSSPKSNEIHHKIILSNPCRSLSYVDASVSRLLRPSSSSTLVIAQASARARDASESLDCVTCSYEFKSARGGSVMTKKLSSIYMRGSRSLLTSSKDTLAARTATEADSFHMIHGRIALCGDDSRHTRLDILRARDHSTRPGTLPACYRNHA